MQKSRLLFLFVLTFIGNTLRAQINETFADGDYTTNPVWTPSNPADWIVNSSFQLQSNNTTANSTFWISTPNALAATTQWDFWVRLDFNPSSTNLVDVYLTASAADISQANTTGYVVRIGNTDDEIALYRKDAGGAFIKIIDGINGVLNASSNVMRIRVIRTAANQWNLLRDLSGTGNSYTSEGTVTDATYNTSGFFGFLVRQSTSGFFQRHYFDDIVVQPYVPDVTPPAISSVTAVSPTALNVLFNEPVDFTTSQLTANYTVDNGIGNPATAVRNAGNNALVQLSFATPFPNGTTCKLTVNAVQDLSGNAISNAQANFSFYIPKRFDVVIDEIMSDPTPQIGLPNAEWIEIRNTTGQTFNIGGWRVGDAGGVSGPLPSFDLKPDSLVIICGTSAAVVMQPFGRTFSVTSFPSLDNNGELIWIQNQNGSIIHAAEYSINWFNNAVKSDGGWTLEMVDTKNPCSSSNWKASVDVRGGSPGIKNSVDGVNKDQSPPQLIRAFATDSVTVVLSFDEPLDSLKGATAANYSISDGIGTPQSAITNPQLFNSVQIRLNTPIVRNKVYTVTANNVTDCSGNVIGGFKTSKLGLSSRADSLDIIINELLFNPKPNGVDYVELYNRSNKVINLKDLFLANRSSTGVVANLEQISLVNIALFPSEYLVVSEDETVVKSQYTAKNPSAFINLSSMPSYSDDKGNVLLLNNAGAMVDELPYDEKWHFALIDNREGVALERINPNGPTKNKDNWTSGGKDIGYGTPSYQNSQFRQDLQVQGEVLVTPEVFSPDNDGFDDFLTISYRFPQNGYVMNVTVFDASGRPVRALQRNALCGQTGSFRWDGLDDKFAKLPLGPYVIFTEIFNLEGKVKRFKNQVVVARKL
ncbi:MAG: lamin tail domain-containing protein [Chitinophagaceae bacterium]|nr:lamin tail domain-containing protein [Chitinophagaceae bacterium]